MHLLTLLSLCKEFGNAMRKLLCDAEYLIKVDNNLLVMHYQWSFLFISNNMKVSCGWVSISNKLKRTAAADHYWPAVPRNYFTSTSEHSDGSSQMSLMAQNAQGQNIFALFRSAVVLHYNNCTHCTVVLSNWPSGAPWRYYCFVHNPPTRRQPTSSHCI